MCHAISRYKFAPRSWVLPMEQADFRREFGANGRATKTCD